MTRRMRKSGVARAIAACASTATGAASAEITEPAPATPAVKQALDEALVDERKAHASYQAIIDRFGEVRPFSNIVHAEQRHIDALLALFARYGLMPPADETLVPAEVYSEDLLGLCKIGVTGEIENVRLYDKKITPGRRCLSRYRRGDAPAARRVERQTLAGVSTLCRSRRCYGRRRTQARAGTAGKLIAVICSLFDACSRGCRFESVE